MHANYVKKRNSKVMKEKDRGGDESLARFKFEGLRNSEALIGRFRRQHLSLSQKRIVFVEIIPWILY